MKPAPRLARWLAALAALALLIAFPLAWPEQADEVVVYTALDQEFSEPIFGRFQRQTQITVRAKFDTEATKTVGLVSALVAEARRPRADVFWNNEILGTLRLERAGLLEAYQPPAEADIPPAFRSPNHTWQGLAARARVLLVNRERLGSGPRPDSIADLADPQWRGQVAVAKPVAGTTATHAACLFAVWGSERAREFFQKLKANDVQVHPGNLPVAQAVARGEALWGLTDTDDALGQVERGLPVEIIYPDQGDGELGTLFIPNTVAILRGSPHPQAARRLIDYLLSGQVEELLADGPSAQIPLSRRVRKPVRVATPLTVRAMEVDFQRAADCWEEAAEFLRQEFLAD